MKIKTLLVEALATERNGLPLSEKLENVIAKFLEENNAEELDRRTDGTILDSRGFGRTLLTVKYEVKAGKTPAASPKRKVK